MEKEGIRNLVGCEGKPGEGPFMLIVLKVKDDCIIDARFQTYGCPAAVACGEFVCDWSEGKSLSSASSISEADVIEGVGKPPLGREHCPGLSVRALLHAIKG